MGFSIEGSGASFPRPVLPQLPQTQSMRTAEGFQCWALGMCTCSPGCNENNGAPRGFWHSGATQALENAYILGSPYHVFIDFMSFLSGS